MRQRSSCSQSGPWWAWLLRCSGGPAFGSTSTNKMDDWTRPASLASPWWSAYFCSCWSGSLGTLIARSGRISNEPRRADPDLGWHLRPVACSRCASSQSEGPRAVGTVAAQVREDDDDPLPPHHSVRRRPTVRSDWIDNMMPCGPYGHHVGRNSFIAPFCLSE